MPMPSKSEITRIIESNRIEKARKFADSLSDRYVEHLSDSLTKPTIVLLNFPYSELHNLISLVRAWQEFFYQLNNVDHDVFFYINGKPTMGKNDKPKRISADVEDLHFVLSSIEEAEIDANPNAKASYGFAFELK